MRLDDTSLEAFSLIAWIQRKPGGRGFAVRKVLRSEGPVNLMRLFEREEIVTQCWSWYIDGVPGLHFGPHNYTAPKQSNGAWSDGKLHLEAVVVNKTHVLMYQDLRLVRVQTLKQAYNSTVFPFADCASSALRNASLEVGGSGLRMADITFFPHPLSIEEMNVTYVRGLPSKIMVESSIGNAHRGWMPREPGSNVSDYVAQAHMMLSNANTKSAEDMLAHLTWLDKLDANRTLARVESITAQLGVQKIKRHFLGGEYQQGTHRAVHSGFRIVEQNTSDRAALGFRDCPFLFNASAPMVPDAHNNNLADQSALNLVRVCLDEPSSKQTLKLPNAVPDPLSTPSRPLSMGREYERAMPTRQGNQPWARTYSFSSKQRRWQLSLSGVVISTGNTYDLAGVPGLLGRMPSFEFSGTVGRAAKSVERLRCARHVCAAAL